MRSSTIVLIASGAWILGRWAHDKPAITIGSVASAVFLMVTIAMLDHGETEPIARGFAWIILAVCILSPDSPVMPLVKLITGTISNKKL